jgi:tRNA-specific 2-thiouridylase
VIENFVSEYAAGRTPIPCVRCNTFTKFRDLLHKADALECESIATGHYARAEGGELLRAHDHAKDQSYFLWGIDRAVVRRMLLPVGTLTKAETRQRARALGLDVVAEKRESQDICFVPDGDHTKVLARHLGPGAPALARGAFVSSDGRVLGEHDGYARFTVGQRRGLPGGSREPLYVVAIRPESREVVIGPRNELLGRGVIAHEVNWLVDVPPAVGDHVQVQVRHRAAAAPAEVVRLGGGEIELALDQPVTAITPGQSLVMFDGERVVGGGLIAASRAARSSLPVRAA